MAHLDQIHLQQLGQSPWLQGALQAFHALDHQPMDSYLSPVIHPQIDALDLSCETGSVVLTTGTIGSGGTVIWTNPVPYRTEIYSAYLTQATTTHTFTALQLAGPGGSNFARVMEQTAAGTLLWTPQTPFVADPGTRMQVVAGSGSNGTATIAMWVKRCAMFAGAVLYTGGDWSE